MVVSQATDPAIPARMVTMMLSRLSTLTGGARPDRLGPLADDCALGFCGREKKAGLSAVPGR